MNKTYKKNYIKEVITRVDFLNPVDSLKEKISVKLSSTIMNLFPIAEPKDIIAKEFQIKSDSKLAAEEVKVKSKEWCFYGRERNKRLCITKDYMIIVFNVYKSFNDLETHFNTIVNSLFNSYKDLQVKRLGLRYINNLEITSQDPFNWKGYLNKNLLYIFNIPKDKAKIARALHLLELNYGSFNLRFQYGMHNPDFPAPIKKKLYILDYDAYSSAFSTKDDIIENLSIFHSEIEKLFEYSITGKLRRKMNEKK